MERTPSFLLVGVEKKGWWGGGGEGLKIIFFGFGPYVMLEKGRS
jgi:hypothetical protein